MNDSMLVILLAISAYTYWVMCSRYFGLSLYVQTGLRVSRTLGYLHINSVRLCICWWFADTFQSSTSDYTHQAGVKVTTFVTILLTTAHVTIRHASIYWHAVIIFAASDGLFSDIHIYQFELCAYVTLFKERGSLTRLNCISYFGNFLKFLNTHFTSLSSNR